MKNSLRPIVRGVKDRINGNYDNLQEDLNFGLCVLSFKHLGSELSGSLEFSYKQEMQQIQKNQTMNKTCELEEDYLTMYSLARGGNFCLASADFDNHSRNLCSNGITK